MRFTHYINVVAAFIATILVVPMAICAQNSAATSTAPTSIFGNEHPLREVRAVWLTTLNGLDWPRTKAKDATSTQRQKDELCAILDKLQRANINTVLLQTRIRGAVIYPSQYEPWDGCITGKASNAPSYDPLAYCIDECHKRGMELHAWVVATVLGTAKDQAAYGSASILKRRPELCRSAANGGYYMLPGRPATADYIAALCKEIATKYDVDGISLDYIRYPESVYRFSDDDLYPKGSSMSKADWRRENITRIVRRVHDEVKAVKPYVKLSSSPIGKYRDLTRYSSKGWNCYDAVWQDPQAWLRDNLQDMLFPMMYFKGDHFYPFVFDWRENSYGHPVLPGLGIYFLDPREGNWQLNDVRAQIHTSRNSGIGGVALYRSDFFTRNCRGLYNTACNEFFPYPALTTRMTWMGDTIAPSAPSSITYNQGRISWPAVSSKKDVMYCVYGSNSYPVDVTRAENLLATRLTTNSYAIAGRAIRYRYFAVTSIDRFGNESAPVQEGTYDNNLPDHIDMAKLIDPDRR